MFIVDDIKCMVLMRAEAGPHTSTVRSLSVLSSNIDYVMTFIRNPHVCLRVIKDEQMLFMSIGELKKGEVSCVMLLRKESISDPLLWDQYPIDPTYLGLDAWYAKDPLPFLAAVLTNLKLQNLDER